MKKIALSLMLFCAAAQPATLHAKAKPKTHAPVKHAHMKKAAVNPNDIAGPKSDQMLEGKRFTMFKTGNGPDVVLIPGLASPRAVWDSTVASLKSQYRLHLVEIRGFGDGAAGINSNGPVIEPFVRELADYIDDEILNKHRTAPAIIGHSLGGLSALMIAARFPKSADKIMVVDALPFYPTIFNPAATVELVKPQAQAFADAIRSASNPAADDKDPGEKSMAGSLSNNVAGRTQVKIWSLASNQNVVAQALYDDMTTDLRGELGKISAPVTLLYAQDDKVMTPEKSTQSFVPQYMGVTNFKAHQITGSYHFIMLDQPDKFAKEVEQFLK
jgi:pimeloyl-ACP methyl ester carboxylesterase